MMNQLRLVNLRIFTAATARQAAEVRASRAASSAPMPSPVWEGPSGSVAGLVVCVGFSVGSPDSVGWVGSLDSVGWAGSVGLVGSLGSVGLVGSV